jgi:hypothetical protein
MTLHHRRFWLLALLLGADGCERSRCEDGATRCGESTREVCQGGEYVAAPCGSGETCDGGECLCDVGATRCDGDRQRCGDGGIWVDDPCADTTPVCDEGACGVCFAGEATCREDGRYACEAGLFVPAPCPAEAPICAGVGACGTCAPGATRCEGGLLETCDATGLGYQASACPDEAPVCREGLCQSCGEELVCGAAHISWSTASVGAVIFPPSLSAFLYPVTFLTPSRPFEGTQAELAADVDGDELTDLVAWGDGAIEVALARAGALQPPAVFHTGATASAARARRAADVTGDGRADLIEWTASEVDVLVSTGDAFIAPAPWLTADLGGDAAHLVGDVDGDGRADLVAVVGDAAWVALSTGDGFAPATSWSSAVAPVGLGYHLADFDGDARADLLAWHDWEKLVALSTGSAFAEPATWSTVSLASWIPENNVVIDVDQDGKNDLLAVGDNWMWTQRSAGDAFLLQEMVFWAAPHVADRSRHVGRLCSTIERCTP